MTILAEIFAWYHDGVDSLTIYTQDTDAHEFQTNAERILTGNSEFTPALDSPISVGVKSNDFVLCQMYREGVLTLDAVRQLRHDDRKLTYTRQQADKSIICRKEVITNPTIPIFVVYDCLLNQPDPHLKDNPNTNDIQVFRHLRPLCRHKRCNLGEQKHQLYYYALQ